MSFFAILLALLMEQVRPMASDNLVFAGLRAWVPWVSRNFDAGKSQHGWIAWSLAVLLPTLLVLALHGLLLALGGWPLALLWSVLVLYATLGFRQFSHHFTGIRDALDDANEERARALLAAWQQVDASALPRSEIVRHVIEYSVLAAHRHVFGVLAWFSVLAVLGLGPAGAVFYRLCAFVAREWTLPTRATQPASAELAAQPGGATSAAQPSSAALVQVANTVWHAVDWLPARLTALSFAVVGNFEEAIDGWRYHAARFPNDNDGVILAATAGAVNVQLGGEALRAAVPTEEAGSDAGLEPGGQGDSISTPGRAPEPAHLSQVVGLVWRSVVVWMALLALLTLARLVG